MPRKTLILILVALFLLIPVVQAEDSLDWTTRGNTALDAKKYSDALTYFNNALAQDPNFSSALTGKAIAYNALGNYQGALDAANRSLSIRSGEAKALNAYALALFNLKDYSASVTAYDNLFVVQTNLPEPYCNQGYACLMINQTDKALASYKKCTALSPSDAMTYNNIGLVYMARGDYTNALASFDQATGISVMNATIWNNKGKALAALGLPSDALQCFSKALMIDPAFVDAQKNKESMNGKLQTFYISITPTTTITLNRLGTPVATQTPVSAESSAAVTPLEKIPGASGTTVPVANKTTYSPLPLWTALGAVLVVAALAAIGKNARK